MASSGGEEVDDRRRDTAAEIDIEIPGKKRSSSRDPIVHPGTVIINVQGAFIVDEMTQTPNISPGASQEEFTQQTHDIRLPHHTAIVSHIAVDVSQSSTPFLQLQIPRS